MTEVKFKMGQMREAADRFRRAGQNIDFSLQRIHTLIQSSEMTTVIAEYQQQRAFMAQWSGLLIEFAEKLNLATDDLEHAMDQIVQERYDPTVHQNPAVLATYLHDDLLRETLGDTPLPEPEPPPPTGHLAIDTYLSDANRPLYDDLLAQQARLDMHETQLDAMVAERTRLAEDLEALENRILTFEGRQPVAGVPRLDALQGQIDALDTQIVTMQGTVDDLRGTVGEITTRLERIALPEGADLGLVMALENGETAEIVVQNTEGCVNHVVTRATVPTNLARDAHLWDDIVRDNPQFGIRIGDRPLEGGVIVMETAHSYADDVNGHLLYIERIEGDQVWVTDNLNPDEPVLLSDLTDELDGENIHYLYLPWHTKA